MSFRMGNTIVLVPEPDRRCELCGKMDETRPFGPNGERVCFDCGMKNPDIVARHMAELIDPHYSGQIPRRLCPVCAQHLDAVEGLNATSQPQPGDFTVCAYCFSLLRFTADLSLEKAPLEVIEELQRQQPADFAQMQQAIEVIQQGRLRGVIGAPTKTPARKN